MRQVISRASPGSGRRASAQTPRVSVRLRRRRRRTFLRSRTPCSRASCGTRSRTGSTSARGRYAPFAKSPSYRASSSGQSRASASRKCSFVPGGGGAGWPRCLSRPRLWPPDDGGDLLRPVRESGQDRRHPDARLDSRLDERRQRPETLVRWRSSGLSPPPDVAVECRDGERDRDVGAAGSLREDVDVADDERAARDERERLAAWPSVSRQRQPVAALGRLVGIGCRPDHDLLAAPRRPREPRVRARPRR